MSFARFVFIAAAVSVAACHSSCSEQSGAEPVVEVEAGPVLGQAHRAPNVRPMMRNVTPLSASSATPTNNEN